MNHSFSDPCIRFGGTFRDYQQAVLDKANTYLKDGRIHVVAAPGSGKTILGLELIRRLGQPALVLSPSVTIRQQWGDRFEQNFLSGYEVKDRPEIGRALISHSLSTMQDKLITTVTYQSLHAAMKRIVSHEETSEWEDESGEENFENFNLLAEVRRAGISTVCLDEAHHLRSEWQKALEEFLKAVGDEVTIIALTATPPYDSTPAEWERYSNLCGEIDAEIFVPQLVAQSTLCPHQDYIYFNYPDKAEHDLVTAHRQKAIDVTARLVEENIFSDALTAAGILPDYKNSEALILEHPHAFSAIFTCIVNGEGTELPRGMIRLISSKGTLMPYRMTAVEEALTFILEQQELFPEALRNYISKLLSAAGLIERKKICLAATDKLKKMLLSSVGKLDSIAQITGNESLQMGQELRMLILTDHIRKELMGAIGTNDPVRSMGTVPIFETLRRQFGTSIPLAVLTGSLIIVPQTAISAVAELSKKAGITCRAKKLGDTGYVELIMSGSNKHKVGVMTEAFAQGCFCVLIGTTSLLGEGWDSPCINALILASFVGSFMLSNQMRGRAIRTDKKNPDKTSNIWHLVTVEPPLTLPEAVHRVKNGEPPVKETFDTEGSAILGNDYATVVRRFEAFLGPAYHSDVIESGIERLDVIKPPYDKDGIDRINREMLALAADRHAMSEKWLASIGENLSPEISQANEIPEELTQKHVFFRNMLSVILATIPMMALFTYAISTLLSSGSLIGMALSLPVLVLYIYGMITWVSKVAAHCSPARSIKALSGALLKTLKSLDIIESRKAKVQILPTDKQGSIVCTLRNATEHEKNVFATAVAELLSPILNPRYVIIRKQRFFKHTKFCYGESFACPSVISNKKENVFILAKHLAMTTGNFEPFYTRSEDGRAVLLLCRKKAYVNRNEKSITGKKIVRSKWD